MLFPDLNVAENIFISHQDRGAVVDWRQMYREAEAILAELGVALDVRSPARGLTLAAQQTVEIAKAISLNVRVLIMDEPTASLSAHEVAPALQAGHATCATRASPSSSSATAWRKSSRSPTGHGLPRRQADLDRAARRGDAANARSRDMVGPRDRGLLQPAAAGPARRTAAVGARPGARQASSRTSASTSIAARCWASPGWSAPAHRRRPGALRHRAGRQPATIVLRRQAGHRSARRSEAHALGIAYVSEDRRQLGLSLPMSIAANITLPMLQRYLDRVRPDPARRWSATPPRHSASGWRSARRRSSSPVAKLSGGNQQKVMLSKWLNTQPAAADPRRADARHRRRRQGRGPRT